MPPPSVMDIVLIVLVPFACASIIFTCAIFFAYLFAHTRDSLYYRFLILDAVTIVFASTEIFILVVGGLQRNWRSSIQAHRVEQLLVALFLWAVPFFLEGILGKDSPYRKPVRAIAWTGLGAAACMWILGFAAPELFVSVTAHSRSWMASPWDYGRGLEGPLYNIRDGLLALLLAYSTVVLFLEMSRTKAYRFILPIAVGFILAIWFAASDVVMVYTGFHIDPFFMFNFSRMPFGVTLFLILTMTSVFRRFLGHNDELQEAFAALRQSEAKLVESNELMTRFVPMEFLTYLDKSSVQDVGLGDCRKMYMTVLFSDIRAFTRLSEKMSPEENFAFINDYLSVMVPIIRDYDGFVDKFIGDAIMALFPGGPNDAVRAAVAMRTGLRQFNRKREDSGQEAIDIGIGINSGELMIGTVGDKYRMEGTVIADAVNLASRMESLTKTYNLGVLMSGESFQALQNPGELNSRFIGQSRVKGKVEPVAVFEIFDGDDEKLVEVKRLTQSDFERGVISLYSGRYDEALGYFNAVLSRNKGDGAADFYSRWILKKRQNLPRSAFATVGGSEGVSL